MGNDAGAGLGMLIVIALIGWGTISHIGTANNGQHTGYVTAVEQEGLIWKTWRAYIKTDPRSSQEDSYCVTDTNVVSQLQNVEQSREQVTVSYSSPFLVWKWECGGESSIVKSVASLGGVPQQSSDQGQTTNAATANAGPSQTSVQPQPTAADKLTTESANGLACKTIANTAASSDQTTTGDPTSVLETHYSKTFNQCYYELSTFLPADGSTSTDIRVAPDDDWIAECSTGIYPPPKLFCTEHHVGQISEQQFNNLESTYLTN